jgi:hypothetical protein
MAIYPEIRTTFSRAVLVLLRRTRHGDILLYDIPVPLFQELSIRGVVAVFRAESADQ